MTAFERLGTGVKFDRARTKQVLRYNYKNVCGVNAPHHEPHFHAYYQDEVAIFTLTPIELIAGSLSRRQQRLVEAWAELHNAELIADWNLLQSGMKPAPIEPLR